MSGMETLVSVAQGRSDGALASWRNLTAKRDQAGQKLMLLKQHAERYRDLMHTGLQQGMPAASTVAHLGFIGQIEEVVVRLEKEVESLKQACARQWLELIDARREKRMYEILGERLAAREAVAVARRGQIEIDELLQCPNKTRQIPPLVDEKRKFAYE